jgi:hypothetical protein
VAEEVQRISRWLQDVKRDLKTPDLWAELQREAELLGANFDDVTENSPFTSDEQNEIAGRLRELADHARRTYSLSEAQIRLLDAKLGYLVGAAGRLGRIDWLNAFAGRSLVTSSARRFRRRLLVICSFGPSEPSVTFMDFRGCPPARSGFKSLKKSAATLGKYQLQIAQSPQVRCQRYRT